ncbi:MAG: RNA polymerase sigma factor [Candidatus Aminicenantes bacterium]
MDEDKELIQRTLKGEKEAFEMIIQKYQNPLLNYIGRMVGERELALDFTQEVFVKTYSSLHSFKPRYKFRTWLFKIASNHVIDYWRKKKISTFSFDRYGYKDQNKPSFQIPDDEPPVAKKFELSELRAKIEQALKNVPPSLRELFIWRHVNEFSYEEMAEMKDLPVGTVKNRVFQAKEMVRQLLEEKI